MRPSYFKSTPQGSTHLNVCERCRKSRFVTVYKETSEESLRRGKVGAILVASRQTPVDTLIYTTDLIDDWLRSSPIKMKASWPVEGR